MKIPSVYQSIQQSLKKRNLVAVINNGSSYNEVIIVQDCLMNFYYNCFKYDNYFSRGRYLFDNNDDRANTLGDSKPKHHDRYISTENKVKSHKATI